MRLLVGLAAVACVAACGESPGPDLSSTSQLAVVLMPESHDFGNVVVGQTSPAAMISVAPAPGANSDSITSVQASCPDFAVSAPGLPATVSRACGSSTDQDGCSSAAFAAYAFGVTFTPTVAGQVSCVVTITLDGATTSTVTVTGTGAEPPLAISVAPAAVAFGDLPVSAVSSSVPVAVTNHGSAMLTVASTTVSTGYTVTGGGSFHVSAAQTVTLQLACTPPALGAVPGTLTIASDDPQHATVAVPLTCNGVTTDITTAPDPARFAATRVGEPITLALTIANNNATTDTTFQSAAVAGSGFSLATGPTAGDPLPAGAAGTLAATVQFDAATHGAATGTLTIVTDAGTRTIAIAATAGQPSLSLTPDGAIDFGPVCIGATATQQVTAVDDGDADFTLMALSQPDVPFALTAEKVPIALTPGGATPGSFAIAVAPTDPGPVSSTVAVTTDIPLAAPRMLQLAALGLGSGTTATPTSLDLGSYALDTTSLGAPIAISNCSADPLPVSNPRVEGADATEFAIVQQPSDLSIAANVAATWVIAVTPHTAGRKQAQFSVDTALGTTSVPLFAEGLAPAPVGSGSGSDPGDGDGEHNYYTCAAGDAGAGGLVPLSLPLVGGLALRRRRRRTR